MSIPLVRNNTKDAINTSIIAIKKNLERINSLLGLMDSNEPDLSGLATKQELKDAVTKINNTIDEVETSLQPVNTVTSGNMHSVTSNAVASTVSTNITHLIPMRLSSLRTDFAQWERYLWLGIGFEEKYNSFPKISGKTKKVRLIVNIQTDSNNLIIFGAKRQSDTGVIELFRQNVYGGIGDGTFSRQVQVTVDPSFLAPYTEFYFMSDVANVGVAVCYLFAEVYYE